MGKTPLFIASEKGHVAAVRALITFESNLNTAANVSDTLIMGHAYLFSVIYDAYVCLVSCFESRWHFNAEF